MPAARSPRSTATTLRAPGWRRRGPPRRPWRPARPRARRPRRRSRRRPRRRGDGRRSRGSRRAPLPTGNILPRHRRREPVQRGVQAVAGRERHQPRRVRRAGRQGRVERRQRHVPGHRHHDRGDGEVVAGGVEPAPGPGREALLACRRPARPSPRRGEPNRVTSAAAVLSPTPATPGQPVGGVPAQQWRSRRRRGPARRSAGSPRPRRRWRGSTAPSGCRAPAPSGRRRAPAGTGPGRR